MTLEEKITAAEKFIADELVKYKNPIVFSSFGKDSMVMLDIIKTTGYKLPILFHREPFHPKKYEFANRIILNNEYTVYDYPPLLTKVAKKGDNIEIINLHQVYGRVNYMPTGLRPRVADKDYLCGLYDLYDKPTVQNYEFIWDLGLIGHKDTDRDPILPVTGLKTNKHSIGSCSFLFPLKDFTDGDIWNYHRIYGLPINDKRYDANNNYKEFENIDYNPDYFHACTSCMDRDKPAQVYCPKLNTNVPNISNALRYMEPPNFEYMEN